MSFLTAERPHLLCIQEARLHPGALAALRAGARALGYSLHSSHAGELAVFVLHGINFVPLRPMEGDERFNLARYGVEVSGERFLICNVHGHPSSAAERAALLAHLVDQDCGDLIVVAGDWNEHIKPSAVFQDIWPAQNTFRKSLADSVFISAPDGCLVTPSLVAITSVEAVLGPYCTQHRPIRIDIAMDILLRDYFAWNKGVGGASRHWTDLDRAEFRRLVAAFHRSPSQGSLDSLWVRWLSLSDGPIALLPEVKPLGRLEHRRSNRITLAPLCADQTSASWWRRRQ